MASDMRSTTYDQGRSPFLSLGRPNTPWACKGGLLELLELLSCLFMANSCSRRHRCLIEPTTMLPPTVRLKTHALRFKCFDRRFSFQPRMTAMSVVVVFESDQFGF